jgi:Domain of Unknown Function (DUF349)
MGDLLTKAHAALAVGDSKKSAGLRRVIAEKLADATPLPSSLSRSLQQLDGRLSELKQWKDYAVAPKRAELIDAMESLVGSTEEPQALAQQIKSLQQEWRTIEKGIVGERPSDWQRFQHASQAAYQPCREYFDAQRKLREENLNGRNAVLERLKVFESSQQGENPDWRLLERVLQEAPVEWRRYFPVDREAGRPLQEEFSEVLSRLKGMLADWQAKNLADKQALIARARHALTQVNDSESTEMVKQLQGLWKEIGPAPRHQDQLLWGEFRDLCNAVYEKRQLAHAEYQHKLQAHSASAVALCAEAERVAALSGAALLEAGAKIGEWLKAFEALPELPKADDRSLRIRFERAVDSCRVHLAEQHVRDAAESFTHLFEAARLVHALEWAVRNNADAAEETSLRHCAQSYITGVRSWPSGGLKAINESLTKATMNSDVDMAVREKALRLLCIGNEIHCDMPTPPEDEALRREYQLQRLTQAMGQGRTQNADPEAMMLDWVRMGAVSPAVHQPLRDRFMRSWAHRPVSRPASDPLVAQESGDGRRRRDGRDRSGRARVR